MSKLTLIEKIEMFEEHQLDLRDRYGADTLCRARERITNLALENEQLREALKSCRKSVVQWMKDNPEK